MHIVDLDRKLQGTEVQVTPRPKQPIAPALANDWTVPVAAKQVGGYDLVWCGGPVKGPKGAPNAGHSNLGSSNLRETNLRQLSKAAMLARKR